MSMFLEVVLLFLTLLLLLYRYITKNFDKWKKLGIPYLKPSFPAGSHRELLFNSKNFNVITRETYEKFPNDDLYGIYLLGKPVLVVKNLDTIRSIMVKDFNCFVDRNDDNLNRVQQAGGDMDRIWGKMLTSLSGEEWKDMRSIFTPIFTSKRMKGMVRFIVEVGSSLKQEFGDLADRDVDFELKSVFGKFSLDSLASCAFSINPNSFKGENEVFVQYAARIFTMTTMDQIKLLSRFIPGVLWLHDTLGFNVFKPKQTKFFRDIIRQTIQDRRETGARQGDLIDLMIDCMKEPEKVGQDGTEEQDQYERDMNLNHSSKHKGMDEDMVVATALILLVAGYDTTGMTLSYLGYHLAMNPDCQTKLQEEIDEAYRSNDGSLPEYSVIQELPYLEQCILEVLRLHTPVGSLFRTCTKEYRVPNSSIHLKPNDMVIIPAAGIHMDERYYPNPEQFNPENFSKEAKAARSPYTFQGFGQGPRACIGMRFALLEAKIAMMEVLSSFNFMPSSRNPAKFEVDPHNQLGYVKGGLFAKIQRRG